MRLEAEVSLARDSRERTNCGLSLQCVGPVVLDIRKARYSSLPLPSHIKCSSKVLDERVLTPIQIIDIVFRQQLTCPLLQSVSLPKHKKEQERDELLRLEVLLLPYPDGGLRRSRPRRSEGDVDGLLLVRAHGRRLSPSPQHRR